MKKKYSFVEPEVLEKILPTLPPEEKKAALNLFRSKDDLLKNEDVEYILKKGEKVKEKEKYKLKWEDENEKKI